MRKILVTAIVVLLAILAWMNSGYRGTVNLFGTITEGVPLPLIAALSFAAGVVSTLLLALGRRLGAGRRGLLGKASRARENLSQAQAQAGEAEGQASRTP